MNQDAYLYAGLRSPFGRHVGALAGVRPDDLLAKVITQVLASQPFPPDAVEDVLAGCTNQAGEDSRNVARHAALLAGLPPSVPGQTVNRLCASGLAAVVDAARAVKCGEGELFIAGGVESMTRAPFVVAKAETPFSREFASFDTTIGARFPNPRLVEAYGNHAMPETADIVARECAIAREAADAYALASQQRYQQALVDGFYAGEIAPIEVATGRKAPPRRVDADEHPRADSSLESLQKLKPLYPEGFVTAGNASGINDGAVAMLVGSRAVGERFGAVPLARIVSAAVTGLEPRVMGLGPVTAIPKALARAGLTLADIDLIEINEAFAAQVLACLQGLGLTAGDSRVNPNGGAIAIGHPLGATGARLALTAARELQRRQGRYAVVSLCVGVGQGMAMVLERMN